MQHDEEQASGTSIPSSPVVSIVSKITCSSPEGGDHKKADEPTRAETAPRSPPDGGNCSEREFQPKPTECDDSSPPWMQHCFQHSQHAMVLALHERLSSPGDGAFCDECCKRVATFRCSECGQNLCFTCTDAIHIVSALSRHSISTIIPVSSDPPSATSEKPQDHGDSDTPHIAHPFTFDCASRVPHLRSFSPPTSVEHRLHLPVGTNLFFRSADCGRWALELMHGSVVSQDHGVRSSAQLADSSLTFYYRVMWLRGVEALPNGFYRANLLLPTPNWPVEIGLFPSRLSALRAVLTAERIARGKLRRERFSGRWRERRTDAQSGFPQAEVINEILCETEAILGQEFRVRLTQRDDAEFVQAIGNGAWKYKEWMRTIGRDSQLAEEEVADQELDDELLARPEEGDAQLTKAAELLLLWSPRGRLRVYLLEQHELLLPEHVQLQHVASIVNQMLFVYVGFAWRRWIKFISRHRKAEARKRRRDAVTRLQHWWRKLLIERENLRHNRPSSSALSSLDLYRRRQVQAAKLYAWIAQQYKEKQRRALHRWGQCSKRADSGPSRRRDDSWHPSYGICGLPRLPRVYAHKKSDGSVAIDDLKMYKQFRANHAGPTESSYWVIRHRVLAGVYPAGAQAFRDARRIVSRADYVTSILMQEIGTFVCLAEPHELQAHEVNVDASSLQQHKLPREKRREGQEADSDPRKWQTPWLFERLIKVRHDALRVELVSAVKTSERHEQLAKSELEEFASLLPSDRAPSDLLVRHEELINKLTLAQQNVLKSREALTRLKPLEFVLYPIPNDGVPSDLPSFESFLIDLEDRLRRQERFYVFSLRGHGRTGFISALLLGRLYGISATEALERAQRVHDCQYLLHGASLTQFVSSPHAAAQITMVNQLLAHYNDAIYAPIVTENSTHNVFTWRAQQRGLPIENYAARDGFMISDRVDDDIQKQQHSEFEQRQRIAKRESAALKLQISRRGKPLSVGEE